MHFELPATEQDLTFHALEEKAEAEHVVKAFQRRRPANVQPVQFQVGFNNAALIVFRPKNTFPESTSRGSGKISTSLPTVQHSKELPSLSKSDGACTMFERYYSVETIEGARRTTHLFDSLRGIPRSRRERRRASHVGR